MKHIGTQTIKTQRLILRKLEIADAEMMFNNWGSDSVVTRFLRWDSHKTIEDSRNMIQMWIDNYQLESTYYWGMYLQDGEMIGSIGVSIISEYDLIGELGYKIGSRWWGQGYASEAAGAVINYMFNNTDIERIQSYSSVKNPASRKVMEKVGMRYEGLSRHSYRTRDGFQDCTFFGIIRDEWEQMKSILTI